MHWFWLTKCVSCPRLIITIVFWLMVAITLSKQAKSSISRFFSLFANTMIFPFFIKVIIVGLSLYVIPLSNSCPREMRFELQSRAYAIFYSSMVLSLASGIDKVLISLVRITWLAAVTKSMLLALVMVKKMRLFYK